MPAMNSYIIFLTGLKFSIVSADNDNKAYSAIRRNYCRKHYREVVKMDTLGITSQGVVNQATNSTQQAAKTENNQSAAAQEQAIKQTEQVTADFKNRVEQIIAHLKENGANVPASTDAAAGKPAPGPDSHANFMDVIRDVLTGDTSVSKLTFDSAQGDSTFQKVNIATFPFDKSFFEQNLEYLRALVSGNTPIDQQLTKRIEDQLSQLKDTQTQTAAESAPQPAQKPIEQTI